MKTFEQFMEETQIIERSLYEAKNPKIEKWCKDNIIPKTKRSAWVIDHAIEVLERLAEEGKIPKKEFNPSSSLAVKTFKTAYDTLLDDGVIIEVKEGRKVFVQLTPEFAKQWGGQAAKVDVNSIKSYLITDIKKLPYNNIITYYLSKDKDTYYVSFRAGSNTNGRYDNKILEVEKAIGEMIKNHKKSYSKIEYEYLTMFDDPSGKVVFEY